MHVVADYLIVFAGHDIRRENDAREFSLHELLNDDADAFAGNVILRFVVLDARILGRRGDYPDSFPDLGNYHVRQRLILARKRALRTVFTNRRRPHRIFLCAVKLCNQRIQFLVCFICYLSVVKSIRGDDVSGRYIHLQVLHHE